MRNSIPGAKVGLYVMGGLVIVGVALVLSVRPAMPSMWVGVIILVSAAAGYLVSIGISRGQVAETFGSRVELSDDQIYDQFFADSGTAKSLVLDLWREVATILGVPAGRMRPTDRFGTELGPYGATSDRLDALAAAAQVRAAKRGAKVDLAKANTLGEYIRQMGFALR
jgi:hypothetical protein